MPRRTTKRRKHLSKPLPVVFSSFGRSIARVASGSMQKSYSKVDGKVDSKSPGNGFDKHTLKRKITESDYSSKEEDEEMVQADFVFFDPKPDDFHGVKILLQTYLDDKVWDLSAFVDLMLGQTTVGTVVKIENAEDDTPFSIVTALNLGRYKDHKCIMEVKEFLLKVCQENDVSGHLRVLLEDQAHNVGLLVSQRVVNLPPQLLPPLYEALFDEISWATEDEPTKELRESFCFKFYILATKIYKHKSTFQQKGMLKKCTDEPVIYAKPEDEIFHKLSSWSFSYPLHTQQLAAEELKNYRLTGFVMAIQADKVPMFRKELHSLINEF